MDEWRRDIMYGWHKCKTGLHKWREQEEAAKCCNGWTRMLAPWMYGEDKVFGVPLDKGKLYDVCMFKQVLVEESNTEEIAALKAMYTHKVSIAH